MLGVPQSRSERHRKVKILGAEGKIMLKYIKKLGVDVVWIQLPQAKFQWWAFVNVS
jgi:hypothetical protein